MRCLNPFVNRETFKRGFALWDFTPGCLNPFVNRETFKPLASKTPLNSTNYTTPSQPGFIARFLTMKKNGFPAISLKISEALL